MGFLEDLQKKLSTPGAEAFSRERVQESKPHYLGGPPSEPPTSDVTPPSLYDVAGEARRRRRRFFWMVGIVVAVLVVAGGTFGGVRWYRLARTVQKHQVALAVAAPERITSGEDLTLTVRLKNESRVPWDNVVTELSLPDGFAVKSATPAPVGEPITGAQILPKLSWDVGRLPPGAAVDLGVTGRLLGEEGTAALFSASSVLTPANRPGTIVEKTAVSSVVLAAAPIDLTIDVPRSATSGTPITVRVVYQNRTAKDLEGARLVLTPPAGFSVDVATPPVAGRELVWDLPPLPPQQESAVEVKGSVSGAPDAVQPFKAAVGFVTPDGKFIAHRQVQRSLTIERTALALSQALNGEKDLLKVNPGTEVNGEVQYRNTGSGGLREVIVKLTFEGVGLNARSVRVEGGHFDSRRQAITWTAASTPALRALRPGESGNLQYSFTIATTDQLPFTSEANRNFALITQAVGDSPDLPVPPGAPKQVATDRFQMLLNTVPSIALNAFYDDGRAGLPVSTGPLPPEVGKETILTVRVRVHNTSNEITDAAYSTVLPEGIRWVGKEYHTDPASTVAFNERTRDVTWRIPLVPARAGVALPGPEFAFQVGITPSLNQVGQEVALTRGHVLEGTDAFTTARVRAEAEGATTRLVDPRKAEVVR